MTVLGTRHILGPSIMRFFTIFLLLFLVSCSKPISKPSLEKRQKAPISSIIIRDELTPEDVKKIVHYLNENNKLAGIETWLNHLSKEDLLALSKWINQFSLKAVETLEPLIKDKTFTKLRAEAPKWAKLSHYLIQYPDIYELLQNDIELLSPKIKIPTLTINTQDVMKEAKVLFSKRGFAADLKSLLLEIKKSNLADFIFSEFRNPKNTFKTLRESKATLEPLLKLLSLFENNSKLLFNVATSEKELFREFLVDLRPYFTKIYASIFFQIYLKDFSDYKNDKKLFEVLFNAVQLNSQKQWQNPFKTPPLSKFEFYNAYNSYTFAMGLFKFLKATPAANPIVPEMKLKVESSDFKAIGLENFADHFAKERDHLTVLEVSVPESRQATLKQKISYALLQLEDKAHYLKKDIFNKIELAIDSFSLDEKTFSAENFLTFLASFNLKNIQDLKTLLFEDLKLADLEDEEKDRFIIFSEKLEEKHPKISEFVKSFFELIPAAKNFTAVDLLSKVLKCSAPQRKALSEALLFADKYSLLSIKIGGEPIQTFENFLNLSETDQKTLLRTLETLSTPHLLEKHLTLAQEVLNRFEINLEDLKIKFSEETYAFFVEVLKSPETKKIFELLKKQDLTLLLKNIRELSKSNELEKIFLLLGRIENTSIQKISSRLVYFHQTKELEAFMDSLEILGGLNAHNP